MDRPSPHFCASYSPPRDGSPAPWAGDLPPRPWHREFTDYMLGTVVVDAEGREILEVRNFAAPTMSEHRCKAIADIAAAAPDLYDAAKLALDATSPDEKVMAVAALRFAVTKAEGRRLE